MTTDRPFKDNKIFTEEMANAARARLKEKFAQMGNDQTSSAKRITQHELESYPYFDYWEVPWPIEDDEDEPQRRAEATFENGVLLYWDESEVANRDE